MPHETFLELASWYRTLGRDQDAAAVLALSPQNAEVLFWRAFLLPTRDAADQTTAQQGALDLLQRAVAAPVDFVLPFRPESVEVMRWAMRQTTSWKPAYFLALIHLGLGNAQEGATLLDGCEDRPDFAPFYALRATARQAPAAALADLRRAADLDPRQWRFGRRLIERHLQDDDLRGALAVAERYRGRVPDNYVLGMLHARTLVLSGRAADGAAVLATLRVLPYEGATEGRHLHRVAQVSQAIDAMAAGRDRDALDFVAAAREWPEHLGAGKPYPADVDESVEDALQWRVLSRAKRTREAEAVLARLRSESPRRTGAGALATALALRDAGLRDEAAQVMARWTAAEKDAALTAWGARALAGESAAPPSSVGVTDLYGLVARLSTAR